MDMDAEERKRIRDYLSPDIEGVNIVYEGENEDDEDAEPVKKSFTDTINDIIKDVSK